MIDVLIQAGHVTPREPGFEGGTGTVREQEFAAKMQKRLAAIMRADKRFRVKLCGGDIPDGHICDLFISLHGDGASAGAHGYSFGWPANGRDPGRGPALANLIATEWAKIGHPGGHHTDNYTDGMRGYYGWSRVIAGTEVLIEHGFLTNPGEQKWMFTHIEDMAQATYRAVLRHYKLQTVRKLAVVSVVHNDTVIATGNLLTPQTCRRIGGALVASGHKKPYTATSCGKEIAHGRIWRNGRASWLMRQVAKAVAQGHAVDIDGVVFITPDKKG